MTPTQEAEALRAAYRRWFSLKAMEADGPAPDATLVHEASQAIRLHAMAFDRDDQDGLYRAAAAAWRQETGRNQASGRPLDPAEKSQAPARDFPAMAPDSPPISPAPGAPEPRSGEQEGFAMPAFDQRRYAQARRRGRPRVVRDPLGRVS